MSAGIEHPAFRGFSHVMLLSGFSGAAVAMLRTSKGGTIVRKAASEPEFNRSVAEQALRQDWLRGVVNKAAQVAPVLGSGEADGLTFFDMPFIPSRDATNYLSKAAFCEVIEFARKMEDLLETLACAPPPPTHSGLSAPGTCLSDKLQEISAKTAGKFDGDLRDLARASQAMDLPPSLLRTASHGDLTLENILVSAKHDLWLIDPIQSPFDHFWFDWAKLFQDCEGRWHRFRGRPISLNVSWWLRNRWLDAARSLSPAYAARHNLLLGVTFARILPYAKTDTDLSFIRSRVIHFGKAALLDLENAR